MVKFEERYAKNLFFAILILLGSIFFLKLLSKDNSFKALIYTSIISFVISLSFILIWIIFPLKFITFLIFFSAFVVSIAQDNKRALNIQLKKDSSRVAAIANDSILSASIDKNINKNTDAKIEDYLIISSEMDTITVDTSLTIEKYYKMNFLRKDNFYLLPFSNSGLAYNELSFHSKNDHYTEIGAKNKKILLIGSSMGGWIGLQLLKKLNNVIGFIGIAAVIDFTKYKMWNKFSHKIKKKLKIYFKIILQINNFTNRF